MCERVVCLLGQGQKREKGEERERRRKGSVPVRPLDGGRRRRRDIAINIVCPLFEESWRRLALCQARALVVQKKKRSKEEEGGGRERGGSLEMRRTTEPTFIQEGKREGGGGREGLREKLRAGGKDKDKKEQRVSNQDKKRKRV